MIWDITANKGWQQPQPGIAGLPDCHPTVYRAAGLMHLYGFPQEVEGTFPLPFAQAYRVPNASSKFVAWHYLSQDERYELYDGRLLVTRIKTVEVGPTGHWERTWEVYTPASCPPAAS